jgi:anaerobic magnesium-protoporphyrin IX monomethyl ester cyclase
VDLDTLPFPARDLVDSSSYSRTFMGKPVACLVSSRGCKHRCVHCNSVVMGGGSRNVRFRSPANIAAEVRSIRAQFDCLRFNDDHFTGHPRLPEVLAAIAEFNVQFRVFARIEDLTESCCRQLRAAGCSFVSIGLESLEPQNLRMLGRAAQVGHETNVRIARAHGLTVRASFMVGLPFDDDRSIEASFQRAAALGPDEFAVYPLIPYPGTLLWEQPERFGYTIENRDFTSYVQLGRNGGTSFVMQHRNFSPDDVARWRLRAEEILQAGGVRHMHASEVAR